MPERFVVFAVDWAVPLVELGGNEAVAVVAIVPLIVEEKSSKS